MAYSRPLNESEQSPSAQFVNKKSLEEHFLHCTICLEKFDQDVHSPKVLACNHTFCLSCLISVGDNSSRWDRPPRSFRPYGTRFLACPTCRQKHSLGPQGINELQTDHKIIQMMDILSVAEKQPDNVCQQHQNQVLNFFCKKCEVPVCRDCTVVSHKESKGHDVIEISEALEEFTPQFLTTRDRTAEISKKLQARVNLLEDTKEKLQVNKEIAKKRIKTEFCAIETALHARKRELLRNLRHQAALTRDEMTSRASLTEDGISHISELHKLFEDARKRQDVRQLFLLNHQMKEWERSSADKADCKDDDLQWISYTPENTESVRESLQHIGNVKHLPGLLSKHFDTEKLEDYTDYGTDSPYCTSDDDSSDDFLRLRTTTTCILLATAEIRKGPPARLESCALK